MGIFGSLSTALERLDRRAGRRGEINAPSWPVPLNQSMIIDRSGVPVLISHSEIVAANPTVFGVWTKLVQTLSTTSMVVKQRQSNGRLAVATDTSLEQLLREPADRLGLIDLLQWIFNPYLVEGNSLIVKYRDTPGGLPTALLPLDWRYLQAWAPPGGQVRLWATMQTGQPIAIDPLETIHTSWNPPTHGAIGLSPLAALETAVKVDDAAARTLEAQYNHGLRQIGFLVFPPDATPEDIPSPEEMEAMKERVQATLGGVDNAFKIAVLQGGLKFESASMTVADAELLKARDVAANEVYRAYGVRRSAIEDSDGVDLEQSNRGLHRSLIPHAILAQEKLQRQLVDPEPEWRDARLKIEFDLGDLLRGTRREEVETAVHAFVNGLATANESRDLLGWESIQPAVDASDTDRLFVPHAQLQPGLDGRSLPPSTTTETGPAVRPAGT